MIKIIGKEDLEELSKSANSGNIALSLYIGIKIRHFSNYNFKLEVNSVISNEIRKIKNNALYSKDKKKKILKLVEAVKSKIKLFKPPKNALAIAIFVDSDENEKIFRLPLYISSRLIIESDPYIHPLVKALEKYPRHLVAVIERNKAEFYSIFLGEIEGNPDIIQSDVPKKIRTSVSDDWHGRREKRIERHIENHLNKHFKLAAARIKDYFRKNKFDYLIIGGHSDLTAKFSGFLDKKSKEKLIGIYVFSHRNSGDIKEKSMSIARQHEENIEKAVVDSLIEGVNIKKWASVLGTESVIKNIVRRNAYLLVIGNDYIVAGYVCPVCRYISLYEKKCPNCGNVMAKSGDLADEIIEEAIKKNIETKHLFYSHAEFDKYGIGAFLKPPAR